MPPNQYAVNQYLFLSDEFKIRGYFARLLINGIFYNIDKMELYNRINLIGAAMQVQSQKSELFQVGKRNIINQKMIDKWGNAKIALPRPI
jgi:hypothetical protein